MTASPANKDLGPQGPALLDDPTLRLYSSQIFRGVDREELARVVSIAQVLHVRRGACLIEKGQRNSSMYVLLSGELRVHLGSLTDMPLVHLSPGETVGEVSVVERSTASAFVCAATDVEVLAVPENLIWELIENSHAFAVNLLMQLTSRLRANNKMIHTSAAARQKLERVANFDGLTGIHNRRWFNQTYQRLLTRSQRSGEKLCLVIVDVDHFKSFNDRYGHHAGDQVLIAVAEALTAGMRPTDMLARYGGEEFVLLLPLTDLEGARCCAERLRLTVASARVERPGQEGYLPGVTISLGAAEFRPDATGDQLFARADAALYRAKELGRNQVVCAEDDDEKPQP